MLNGVLVSEDTRLDKLPLLVTTEKLHEQKLNTHGNDENDPLQLARADSLFFKLDQLMVHHRIYTCTPPLNRHSHAIILLHGFMGSVFSWDQSWHQLCESMEANYDQEIRADAGPWAPPSLLLAFDRPGFGLTSRPLPVNGTFQPCLVPPTRSRTQSTAGSLTPEKQLNPYSAQFGVDLLIRFMDAIGIETATLVGHRFFSKHAIFCKIHIE
jgi:pimeloyl-ACP methyl ester carboxylesterase